MVNRNRGGRKESRVLWYRLEATEHASKNTSLGGRPSIEPATCQMLHYTKGLSTGDCTKLSRKQR